MAVRQYIGARYVPKFYEGSNGSQWDSGVQYEPLTIVQHLTNTYCSKKTVPSTVGAPNLNPDYWANIGLWGNIQDEVDQLQLDVAGLGTRVGATETGLTNLNTVVNGIGTDLYNLNQDYQATKALTPLATNSLIVTVGKTGAMYRTINEAITAVRPLVSTTNRATIVIFSGTYQEQIELNPNPGIDFYGIGFPIVKYGSVYPNSPLYTTGEAYYEGIHFVAEDVTNGSYALHIEAQNNETAGVINFVNCKFHASVQAGAGIGLGTGFEVNFYQCEFASRDSSALYFHNKPTAASNQTLRAFNCRFFSPNHANVYVTDAANYYGNGNVSPFGTVLANNVGDNGQFYFMVQPGVSFDYLKDGYNLSFGDQCSNKNMPGADYYDRIKYMTGDFYFTGAYCTINKIDEHNRIYEVTSAVDPVNGTSKQVTLTTGTHEVNAICEGWNGGPIRMIIKGTITNS